MQILHMFWFVPILIFSPSCQGPPQDVTAENAMENVDVGAVTTNVNGSSAERAWCPIVEDTIPRVDCDELVAVDANVRRGVAAFNVPTTMIRGESVGIQLVVDRRLPEIVATIEATDMSAHAIANAAVDTAASNATASIANQVASGDAHASTLEQSDATPRQITDPLPGVTEVFAPEVGRLMRAELTGQGFRVEARSQANQEIPRDGQATWIWDVVALNEGQHTLTLTTAVLGEVEGKRYKLADTLEQRTILVEVTAIGRFREFLDALPSWLKAIAAIFTALTALVSAWLAFRVAWNRHKVG